MQALNIKHSKNVMEYQEKFIIASKKMQYSNKIEFVLETFTKEKTRKKWYKHKNYTTIKHQVLE